MKTKKALFCVITLLVAILSFTSCKGEAGDEIDLSSAQEIIDRAIYCLVNTSLDDIKSYNFDTGMSLEITGEVEALEMSIAMDISGAMDLENKEMSADATISTLMPGEEDEIEVAMEIYVVDEIMCGKTEMPEIESVWGWEECSEEDWEVLIGIITPIESHLDLLELADVSVTGSEEVNGVDCYVLQLTPNLENLWEMASQQIEAFEPLVENSSVIGDVFPIIEDVFQEVVTSYSVKQWVAKDTYFLTKSEIDISMDMTPVVKEVMDAEGMMKIDVALSYLAYDHNQPISIVLPPEAKEAIEEPGAQDGAAGPREEPGEPGAQDGAAGPREEPGEPGAQDGAAGPREEPREPGAQDGANPAQ